jgi:hypothetical protein
MFWLPMYLVYVAALFPLGLYKADYQDTSAVGG